MIVKSAAGILKILDMPIILIQRIVYHVLVLVHDPYAQKQKRCHEQGVAPGLLRKVIVGRYRVLKHMVRKAQGILGYVCNLAHKNIVIFLLISGLVQRDQAVPHGAGVHSPHSGQPQINKLIHPILQQLQILLVSGLLIGLADPVIGHAARPVPGQIHVHGLAHDLMDHFLNLFFVILQSQHNSLRSAIWLFFRIPLLLCRHILPYRLPQHQGCFYILPF